MTGPVAVKRSAPLWLYLAAAVFLVGGVLAYVFYLRESLFWDFRIYYSAAYIFRQGQNPYDNELLYSVSVLDGLPYPYPPPTLYFFLPFTYLDWDLAIIVWPCFIGMLLGLTIWTWWRHFNGNHPAGRFLIVCLLAFNLALPKNIITGNIGALESLLLWTAFAFLLRSDVTKFTILVVLASIFKMTPMVFLALPLLHPQLRKRWKTALVGGATFAVYLLACYAVAPKWFGDYRNNISIAVQEWSVKDFFNSSTYSICRRAVLSVMPTLPENTSVMGAYLLYALAMIPVLVVSWKVLRSLAKRNWMDSGVPLILYATLLYGLLMPRMLDYTFGLVIPAALYTAGTILARRQSVFLLVALLLPVPFISFPSFAIPGDFFFGYWGYWNVLMTFVCWLLFSRHLLRAMPIAPATNRKTKVA